MTNRSTVAIIFAVIVVIEIFIFISQPELTKQVANGQKKGFFSGYDTVKDNQAQQDRTTKYITIIGSTILVGGIITFSLNNKKEEKER